LIIFLLAKNLWGYKKPFGIGHGPAYLGGSQAGTEGTKIALDIYKQYRQYKRVAGLTLIEDEKYYSGWSERDQCIGACPQHSYCKDGICVCNPEDGVVQKYGRCFANNPTLAYVGDKDKYRHPDPPPRPQWCFCENRNGKMEVCQQHKEREYCSEPSYGASFDHSSQICRRGYHNHCLSKDINMYCGEVYDPTDADWHNVCQCRKDMVFDTESMECRILIDVDCTQEKLMPLSVKSKLARLLKKELDEPDRDYSQAEAKSTFCNLLDSVAEEYAAAEILDNGWKVSFPEIGFLFGRVWAYLEECDQSFREYVEQIWSDFWG